MLTSNLPPVLNTVTVNGTGQTLDCDIHNGFVVDTGASLSMND